MHALRQGKSRDDSVGHLKCQTKVLSKGEVKVLSLTLVLQVG